MSDSSNFYSIIQASFPSDPNKIFLDGPGFDAIRYGDIDAITARFLHLFGENNISPGARVVVQVPKSPLAVMLYLACLRAGAIYVPLNSSYTLEELDYFIADTAPTLFVCPEADRDRLSELFFRHNIPYVLTLDDRGQGTLMERSAGLPESHDTVPVKATDIAVIIYTSGTTGKPKGAMLSHGNLASNALTLKEIWGWREDDVLIHALPIYHIHGLFVALHLALLGGSRVHFLPQFDADKIIDLLPESTVLMGVPTFYTRLLRSARLNPEACRKMRLFISGSAPLLPETFKLFEEASGHRILERYGMSECGMLASNPLDGERLPGSVGYALPGVEWRICDKQGRELGPKEIGVLQVKGPNVFSGYWRKPELNTSEFADGYFITGDLASAGADGRISIVGRNKDLIISGGFNVYPKEVELVIDKLDSVLESAVIGVPHEDFGEAVVAVVVAAEGQQPDPAALLAAMKEQLAAYKLPKQILLRDELPRNAMGKVQKQLLREQYADTFKAS